MKLHYCGGVISFIDFFPVSEKSCCEGKKKASCCKDKIARINSETIQDNTQVIIFSFPDYAKFNLVLKDFSFLSALETKETGSNQVIQPNTDYRLKLPLYLRNRVLLV
jgi:hypothetical protein